MNSEGGIVLVDKEKGFTSHDVVDLIRRRTKFKKVGHAGTLDPMATGLLIMLLGSFTKRSNQFLNYDKEYDAEICLGVSTDTADSEGKILEEKEVKVNEAEIKDVFLSFVGEISQVPPMFSAKKVNGKPLYKLARKGIVLERSPKIVSVKRIEINDISLPKVKCSIECSKGTYIRQLAHDIGSKLGCGAHLTDLRRTKIGPFSIENAISSEEFRKQSKEENSIYENILQPK